jgi:hypothetical protein
MLHSWFDKKQMALSQGFAVRQSAMLSLNLTTPLLVTALNPLIVSISIRAHSARALGME